MAMTMSGEVQLSAPREEVWAKLNDAEVLKACIPGCEELNKVSDTEFQAVATTKIGPVKAKFKGRVHLTDLDPPNGYKISGEGKAASLALPRWGDGGAHAQDAAPCSPTTWRRRSGKLAQLGSAWLLEPPEAGR